MPSTETVLARLNGEPLTLKEFLEHLRGQDGLKGFRGFLEQKIIEQRAQQEKLEASEEELQQAADSYRLERGLLKAAEFEQHLRSSRHLQQDFDDHLRRQEQALLARKLREKLVREEAVEAFFFENRLDFDRARISRIVVKEEGLAQELSAQVREGRGFADLARKYSILKEEAWAGGYAGTPSRRDMPSELEALVFGAKNNSLVGPAAVEGEHHLVWVHELIPAQLTAELREIIRQALFERWLESELRKATIELLFAELPPT